MSEFYRQPPESWAYTYNQNSSYYFSYYEEKYEGDIVLISGILREKFKYSTDMELWMICFGGLNLERFEVKRCGLRVEIMGKMKDIKKIRENIEEYVKRGLKYE